MITVITGLTGSGKTWLMSRLAFKRHKKGEIIYPNLAFTFPNNNEGVIRWYSLSEIYALTNGVICIDEGQKLFNARLWPFLPISFFDKITSSRHEFLDIITTTQDFGFLDLQYRNNCHELYHCQSLFRFPKTERIKPVIQIIKIIRKQRSFDDTAGVKWSQSGKRIYWLSKFWTKDLYNSHANINLSHYICQIKRENKKWLIILQSRQLVNQREHRG